MRRRPAAIGRFAVQAEVGRGGMGVVYRGWDEDLARAVAIKVVLDTSLDDDTDRARFLREARVCARLAHPGIVSVYEVGEHEGSPYLVMDFVTGESLEDALARGLKPRRIAEILRDVATALDHAHRHGVVHRDVKPHNILIDLHGKAVLTDFGLAHDARQNEITRTGDIVGTPAYMAPEQAGGSRVEVGAATDVWALGAVLYRALTGRPPFEGEKAMVVLHQIITCEPDPPRQIDPTVHPDLETIALKCLEKNPARRYPSAAAVARELGRMLAGRRIHARPLGPGGKLLRWAGRNQLIAGLFAALVVVLIGSTATVVTLLTRRDSAVGPINPPIAGASGLRSPPPGLGATSGPRPTSEPSEGEIAPTAEARAAELEALLESVRRAELAPGETAWVRGIATFEAVGGEVAARAAADALHAVSLELHRVTVALHADAAIPTPDEARIGLEPIEGLEEAFAELLSLGPDERPSTGAGGKIAEAARRLEARRALTHDHQVNTRPPGAPEIIARAQLDQLGHGTGVGGDRLRLARFCADVLVRLHAVKLGVPALGRHVRVEADPLRAAVSGVALARLGGVEARAWLDEAKRHFPLAGPFWEEVLRSRAGETDVEGADVVRLQRQARIHFATNDVARALEDLDRLIEIGPSADDLRLRGSIHMIREAWDAALADLDRSLELDPRNARTLVSRSGAHLHDGDADAALRDAIGAIELSPSSSEARIARALAYQAKGNPKRAIADFTHAARLDPRSSEAWSGRALAKRDAGDLEGALEDFAKALEIDPRDSVALGNRGLIKLAAGDGVGALVDLRRAVELRPRDVRAQNALGQALVETGDPAGAVTVYEEAVALAPRDAMSRNGLATARLAAGDAAGAAEDFARASALAPRNPIVLKNLADALREAGDPRRAIEALDRALVLAPRDADIWVTRGGAKRIAGDPRGAIADFTRALEIDPDRARSWLGLAVARQDIGDRAGTIDALEQFLALAPTHSYAPDVRAWLARLRGSK